MTREETKKAIEVMQAFIDGKKIKKSDLIIDDPSWNWYEGPYEIAEEPKQPFEIEYQIKVNIIREHPNADGIVFVESILGTGWVSLSELEIYAQTK